jgi:C-terminal processing protease CtpA/Prc
LKQFPPIDDKVSLNIIDTNFVSIKIARSDFTAKNIVDSLVALNKSIIEKTPNLIIDIRNNTGGTWSVYKSLFPYIYTNPMIGGEQLRNCSEDFIEKQKQSLDDIKKDPNLVQFLSDSEKDLDSMIKYKGSYYYSEPDTIKFDSITAYPKKVIILTNYRCISASEMFLKFCQQSKKVIIAGEKTWGAVDNVGVIPFDSPSGNIRLFIPRTKNSYKKNLSLDFVGIHPNVIIPSAEVDWTKFIINYLAKEK